MQKVVYLKSRKIGLVVFANICYLDNLMAILIYHFLSFSPFPFGVYKFVLTFAGLNILENHRLNTRSINIIGVVHTILKSIIGLCSS